MRPGPEAIDIGRLTPQPIEVKAILSETDRVPSRRTPSASGQCDGRANDVVDAILASLDKDKGEEIVVIDLAGKTTLADFMIIASGRSARQVVAMADHLLETLKLRGNGPVQIEGKAHADWVLIDAGDVIVHLFRPEVRAFYNLEKMWGDDQPLSAEGERYDVRPARHGQRPIVLSS